MNVQPASHAIVRPSPVPTVRGDELAAARHAPPGWDGIEPADLTGFGRQQVEAAMSLPGLQHPSAGALPPQQAVAGPPLPIAPVQPGALPQDRSPAMPAAIKHHPAPGIDAPAGFGRFRGHAASLGPDGLYWHAPPPGMLTALQEGGRARIAALYP